MERRLLRLLICFLVFAAVCFGQNAKAAQPDFSQVIAMMESRVNAGTPSIAIAVAHHGRIVWEHAVGLRDKERREAATVNTPYYLASVSKTVTATAMMALVQSRKLELDRPVNDYLRGAQVKSPLWDASQVTVKRVTNHTAGFATYDHDCYLDNKACDPSTLTAIRRYGTAVWKPGEAFDYSNLGYGVLGEIIAQKSGSDLGTALRRLVFSPLGMSSCSLGPLSHREVKARRYDSTAGFAPTPLKLSTTPGGSAVYCSVHDVALFGMFHLKNHLALQKTILTDAAIEQMQSPSLKAGETPQYGLSWWLRDVYGYPGALAQGGTIDSTAYLQLIPSEDLAVALLSNTGMADGDKIVEQVLAAVLPSKDSSAKQPPSQPPATKRAAPGEMAGSWHGFLETYRGRVLLNVQIEEGGVLVAKLGSSSEVRVEQPRFADQGVRWNMPGALGVEGEPFNLGFKVYLRDGALTGVAETTASPGNRNGIRTFYFVQLKR